MKMSNSQTKDFAVDANEFNVKDVIISTYRNEKKDYLLAETRQPHKGLEMFL